MLLIMKINILIYSIATLITLNLTSTHALAGCNTCSEPKSCGCKPCDCPPPANNCCPKIQNCDAKRMAYYIGRLIGFYEVSMNTYDNNPFAGTTWTNEKLAMNKAQAEADLEIVLSRTNSTLHDDILSSKAEGIRDANHLYQYGNPNAICQNYQDSFDQVAYYENLFQCNRPCPKPACPCKCSCNNPCKCFSLPDLRPSCGCRN